ncbi:response regulator [Marinomonas rhizomae]|uniref:Two-component system response regulator BaeR n=1 Tax=Marinomonas rhizomae TaxID=491948 RepID=A0A366J0F5_9GAMM|nr:response regulator [Marinomonas rhizomae]RBP79438.1 two-component system response regulator BaeR [Marinomonas rhizomae]RNF71365.1 response regulator [Marinomonas rhizomae]
MSDLKKSILVVEDEPTLSAILCEYFEHYGFHAQSLDDGALVVDFVKENMPDLIILDLMLPNRGGLDIYRDIRTFSHVPIMMATAKIEEIDRLIGLELGADDYICKPYSTREVVVRAKNILRRNDVSTLVEQKDLVINDLAMTVTYHQQVLTLTPAEFKILAFLFKNSGKIYSRDQLMNHIYNDQRVVADRAIDSHIKNLRKKMADVDPSTDCIRSVYGVGYKFDV